jgi:hypothetical protein
MGAGYFAGPAGHGEVVLHVDDQKGVSGSWPFLRLSLWKTALVRERWHWPISSRSVRARQETLFIPKTNESGVFMIGYLTRKYSVPETTDI